MKQFSSYYKYILLLCFFFLVCPCLSGMLTGSHFFRKSPDTFKSHTLSEVYEGSELVLLWNHPIDATQRERFLASFPSCNIIETLDNYMLISISDSSDICDVLARIRTFPGIAAADPNYPLELCYSDITGNPPVNNTSPEDFFYLPTRDLRNGLGLYLDTLPSARETIIAVADTGIDTQHPLLTDLIWTNLNEIPDDGIDNDENGYIDDINGWDFYHNDASVCHYALSETTTSYSALPEDNDNHGTHVAGIIASVLRGGSLFDTNTASVPIRIMPLKIHGGEKSSGSVANAIKAIKYAVMMDADICNISWGSSSITSSITTLEQTIRESDMLFVTAAGNTGSDNDQIPVYPASFRMDNVISVTFVNTYGLLTSKSNYGAQSVDIAAPGTDVYSTIVGNYAYMSGSSMAVPYVSGIAGLLYSCTASSYPAAIKEHLLSNIYLLPFQYNYPLPTSLSFAENKLIIPGIPNLSSALTTVAQLPTDTTAPVLSASTSYTEDFIRLNVTADDTDGSGIRVLKYASGTKNVSAFHRGTIGTAVTASGVLFAKPGNYTLYASDYAGNETILHYYLSEDAGTPVIHPSLHYSPSGNSCQLIAEFFDEESEIAAVYIHPGEYDTSNFPTADAQVLPVTDYRINLRLDTPGCYTMYAEDIRGNTTTIILTFSPEGPEPEDSEELTLD